MRGPDKSAPFGGRLSTLMDKSLRHAVEQRLASGVNAEELIGGLQDFDFTDLIDALCEPMVTALRRGTRELLTDINSQEQELGTALTDVWGPADDMYRATMYIAYELGAEIAKFPEGEELQKVRVLSGIHGRAVRTAAEIRYLAMGGFAAGASARWRSLHELAVMSGVLGRADPDISTRYLDFGNVERLKDMQDFQVHAASIGRAPFSEKEVTSTREAVAVVKERWGPGIVRENGWALPLFPERKGGVQFRELEAYADLGHLRPFYRLGSHYVHAGPRASQLNMSVGATGDQTITAGASVFQDIAETCHGALISLLQATSSLVVARLAGGSAGAVDLLVGLKCLLHFTDDAGGAYGKAADRARDRGWFSHTADEPE